MTWVFRGGVEQPAGAVCSGIGGRRQHGLWRAPDPSSTMLPSPWRWPRGVLAPGAAKTVGLVGGILERATMVPNQASSDQYLSVCYGCRVEHDE
jgi:hypothetical protein